MHLRQWLGMLAALPVLAAGSAEAVMVSRQGTPWMQVLRVADAAIAQGDYDTAFINLRRAKQFTTQPCDLRYVDILLRAVQETKESFPERTNEDEILLAYNYFFTTRIERLSTDRFQRFCPQYSPM